MTLHFSSSKEVREFVVHVNTLTCGDEKGLFYPIPLLSSLSFPPTLTYLSPPLPLQTKTDFSPQPSLVIPVLPSHTYLPVTTLTSADQKRFFTPALSRLPCPLLCFRPMCCHGHAPMVPFLLPYPPVILPLVMSETNLKRNNGNNLKRISSLAIKMCGKR